MANAKTAPMENEISVPQEEKIVTIRLPRERKDQEDEVVWVNDRRFLIKRGVPVDVPESVALILEEKEKMLQYSYEFESRVQN